MMSLQGEGLALPPQEGAWRRVRRRKGTNSAGWPELSALVSIRKPRWELNCHQESRERKEGGSKGGEGERCRRLVGDQIIPL